MIGLGILLSIPKFSFQNTNPETQTGAECLLLKSKVADSEFFKNS
jgi:hypothetical protein